MNPSVLTLPESVYFAYKFLKIVWAKSPYSPKYIALFSFQNHMRPKPQYILLCTILKVLKSLNARYAINILYRQVLLYNTVLKHSSILYQLVTLLFFQISINSYKYYNKDKLFKKQVLQLPQLIYRGIIDGKTLKTYSAIYEPIYINNIILHSMQEPVIQQI